MAGESKQEKTEQPTFRRKQKARQKGQVIKSNELKSAAMILSGVLTLKFAGPWMKTEMMERFLYSFCRLSDTPVTAETVPGILGSWGAWTGQLLAPLFVTLVCVGVAATWAIQGGFLLTSRPLALNLGRLNPITGAAQLFSGRVFFNLFRDGIKVVLIAYVCYRVVREAILQTLNRTDIGLGQALSNVSDLAVGLCLRGGAVLLLLGFMDYAYQRRQYIKDLKMTKREVKDEYKESEGDPLIRGRIRSAQKALAQKRMMQAVPKADVVLTNPTTLAVALRYDPETMNAPKVVAKGQRLIAERIKELARTFDVPIVEDKFLARSLFKTTPVDGEVPMDLYRAVAEVLSYVYRLKGKLSSVR